MGWFVAPMQRKAPLLFETLGKRARLWCNTLNLPNLEVGLVFKQVVSTAKAPSSFLTLEKLSMKKTLIALAVLAASGASFAQSAVTLSGGMTFGLGTTEIGTAGSGLQLVRQTGNLQFAGTEDLGGGLKAGFQLQTSIGAVATTNTTTSIAANRTILGDRAANMTLSGGFGTATVGRGNTAVRSLFGAMGDVSRLAVVSGLSAGSSAAATAADNGTYVVSAGDANARIIYGDTFANAVGYTSPAMNGFQVSVGLVPVQDVTSNAGTTVATRDTLSYTVTYTAGPLGVGFNLTDQKGSAAPNKMNTLVASYDLGVAKFGLTFQTISLPTGTNPGDATAITANIPMGAGSIGLGYGKRIASDSTHASFAGDDVKQMFAGYRYDLSKRTNVQLAWNNINRAGTATDVKEAHVLLAHTF